ncbi:MAG: aspartyl-phosphate phosphatase Spo0E family protein [Bacillota bacterium]|nr:aspartyl-phosphate phosphatase Spo0E family protein [Bacillota bacterium]
MYKIKTNEVRMEKLKREINEMREILNEICCASHPNDGRGDSVRLMASKFLDELIVEYMKGIYLKDTEAKGF